MFMRGRRPRGEGVTPLACLICVAGALAAPPADAQSAPKITRGPYLQALTPTSVEIRAELDAPATVAVTLLGDSDGGRSRTVRDDAAQTMHVVRLDGLRPSTRYAYSLAAGASVAKGELTTAPPNDSRTPFTFLVYGDNRSDDAAHSTIVRAMLQSPSDFVINTGDLVQDGSSDANWQAFFDAEAPLIRERDVFACVGNHEITDGSGASYLRYFGPTLDAHGDGQKPKLYGSFRWGDARFFVLDAMDSFDSDPERAWLDEELSRADSETGLVWRFVVMHHGPWSSGPHGGNARALRAGIPALFAAHHVDLVLAGHDHIYERGTAAGVRYVVSGGGGAPLYEIKNRLAGTRKLESVHHFIEVTVESDAVRLVTKRDDGSVLERCGMTKGRDGWDCDPAPAPGLHGDSPPPAQTPATSRWGCGIAGASPRAPLGAGLALGVLAALALGCRRGRRNAD
jgi:predicted phosphodiesterase